jgi:Holliday junction resolvase-like predicted endonuclease
VTERGYELAERNYRSRFRELDLILQHGNTLVYVGVKMRRASASAISSKPPPPATKPPSGL